MLACTSLRNPRHLLAAGQIAAWRAELRRVIRGRRQLATARIRSRRHPAAVHAPGSEQLDEGAQRSAGQHLKDNTLAKTWKFGVPRSAALGNHAGTVVVMESKDGTHLHGRQPGLGAPPRIQTCFDNQAVTGWRACARRLFSRLKRQCLRG